MNKPTRYFVIYETDGSGSCKHKDFNTRACAKRFMKDYDGYSCLYERVKFQDITPAGDPCGLLWAYDEKLLEECE